MSETKNTRVNPWVIVGRMLFTMALVCTVVFIFCNSMQVAEVSGEASAAVLALSQGILHRIGLNGLANGLTDHIVRKLAHFSEYALLGFWMMLCLRVYTRHWVKHVSWPVLGAVLVALCDETIQLFRDGRSGQITDVWIDTAGSMTGLLCGLLLLCICRMIYLLFKYRDKE